MTGRSPELLVDGLVFGEGPRWRGDRLWFSDMHGEGVRTVDASGRLETAVELPGREPSGLGFLPDGTLLVVSMLEPEILRVDGGVASVHADLSGLVSDRCNDMVVDAVGNAYVGTFPSVADPKGVIVHVAPDGSTRVAAEDLAFPNGSVVADDGATLIVAESLGRRFTQFQIAADGSLTDRRRLRRLRTVRPRRDLHRHRRRALGGDATRTRVPTHRTGRRDPRPHPDGRSTRHCLHAWWSRDAHAVPADLDRAAGRVHQGHPQRHYPHRSRQHPRYRLAVTKPATSREDTVSDQFSNRRVIVTGGATGVGAALLELLAEQGARDVTVLDVKAPPGPHATFIETDLSDRDAADAAVAAIEGPVDVLFNNAGVADTLPPTTVFQVNALAPVRLANALLPQLREGGAIVNTASIAGLRWSDNLEVISELLDIDDWEKALAWFDGRDLGVDTCYSFTKQVVQVWTMRFSQTASARGVRVNSVCPAPIDTPLLADFRATLSDAAIDWSIAAAGGRLVTPREVAQCLAWLASAEASFVNGVNLNVDGGLVAGLTTGQARYASGE